MRTESAGSRGRDCGSPSRDSLRSPGSPARPHPGPGPRPTPEAVSPGTALSPQVPRRVAGPRAEAPPRPSGMGAGGPASRALAWASLPLLGPPAGALCEDTICCGGKAGPPAGVSIALPRHLLGPLSPSPPQVRSGGRGGGDPRHPRRACGEEPGVLCTLTFSLKKLQSHHQCPRSDHLPFRLSLPIWKMGQ